MKSWKSRLLMVFTMLAVVLVISVPAMADDLEVECEADDSGYCVKDVSHEVWHEDTGSEPQEDVFEEPVVEKSDEEPVVEGSDEECFPFCGLDWWPY
jgi:hypothetical protein